MPLSDRSQTEGRITLAIAAYKSSQVSSLRAASRAFDVPLSTLSTPLRGVSSRRDTRPTTRELTSAEEEVLLQRILDLDSKGFPPRLSVVRETANIILENRGTTPPATVGTNWVSNFIKRQPMLRTTYNRPYDYRRSKCEDPVVIQGWFALVQHTKAEYGILEEDIYNFDETGFRMGVITTTKVVTRAERKGRARTVQPGNTEFVTVIHGINSQGWQIPPFIILAAKLHQRT